MTATELRVTTFLTNSELRRKQIDTANDLKEKGYSISVIGELMGIPDSLVRSLLGGKKKPKTTQARNLDIWQRKTKKKQSLKSIADEYGLSVERVRQIVAAESKTRASASLRDRFMWEFGPLTAGMQQSSMSIKGLFNGLMRMAPAYAKSNPEDFLEWFLDRDILDFAEAKGFGPIRAGILMDIQDKIRSTKGLREALVYECRGMT